MKKEPLWNSILPGKVYVILDARGKLLSEVQGDYAHLALKEGKQEWGDAAKTAIEKQQWLRMEVAQTRWLVKGKAVEAWNCTIQLTDQQLKQLFDALTITKEEYDEWNKDLGKEPPPGVHRVVMARSALGLSLYAGDYVIGFMPPHYEPIVCV